MIVEPIFRDEPRSWRERLFTWPWQPFQATRRVRDFGAEQRRFAERARASVRDRYQTPSTIAIESQTNDL